MALGRPKNQYRKSLVELMGFWSREPKFPTMEEAVTEAGAGIGVVAYALDRTQNHMFRVTLVPTDGGSKFFWVRLETADNSADFAIPSPMACSDLPALLNWWGVLDQGRNVQWVEGPLASPFFPDDWKMPRNYVLSPQKFNTLIFDTNQRRHEIQVRAGLHTIKTSNASMRLAGVMGPDNIWTLINGFRKLPADVVLPTHQHAAVNPVALNACWSLSADYFREKLLKAGNKTHPFIPHSHLIDVPLHDVSAFEP